MTGCAEALTDLPAPLPCLETLQAEVEVYAQTLASLNARQEGSKSTKGDKSDIVETARLVLCKKLRTVTAMLMIYYEDQPERIENYFALTLIRRTTQTTFEGTTAPQQTSFIAERTLQPDGDDVLLINAGPGELKFWMAEQKNQTDPPPNAVSVANGENKSVSPTELGASADYTFLMVYNPDAILEGDWEVDI